MLRPSGPRHLRNSPRIIQLSPTLFGLWLSFVLGLAVLIGLIVAAA
jgi:hypothetical protein